MAKRLSSQFLPIVLIVSLTTCAPVADAPLNQPAEVMVDAWGPFARQCTRTQISYYTTAQRNRRDVFQHYTTCTGFSAFPNADGSVQITGSTSADNQSSEPTVSRFLRRPSGVSRIAAPGDTGLLAYGSDEPVVAERLEREIGVSARQLIAPNATLLLPFHLDVPSTTDGVLSCHLDGQRLDRGRKALVFSCALDEHPRTDRLDAHLHLSGVEVIDVPTGVRLTSVLSGWLTGRQRSIDLARWQPVDDHIWYSKETEFETP